MCTINKYRRTIVILYDFVRDNHCQLLVYNLYQKLQNLPKRHWMPSCAIPGLEMSRAVPYLDVRIILPGAGGDNSQYSGPKPMSLGTFLVGDKSNVTGDSSNILNSHFLTMYPKSFIF